MHLYADYHDITDPKALMKVVDKAAAKIKAWLESEPHRLTAPITHVVVTGISGQSIGWPVSYKIGLPLAVVKKDGEKGHTSGTVIGTGELGDYVILDDLISTGATINRVVDQIKLAADLQNGYTTPSRKKPKLRAIFLHNTTSDYAFKPSNGEEVPVISTGGHYE